MATGAAEPEWVPAAIQDLDVDPSDRWALLRAGDDYPSEDWPPVADPGGRGPDEPGEGDDAGYGGPRQEMSPVGGLARLGLAADDVAAVDGDEDEPVAQFELAEPVDPVARFELAEPGAGTSPAAAGERDGDRIAGWVRPEYDPEPGRYWTPVPESHAGYGWPVPVERLPAAPPYQSEFQPEEVVEPTALVPQWPPASPSGRIALPRDWPAGEDPVSRRSAVMVRHANRRPGSAAETAEPTEALPTVPETPRRRPRPRPSIPATENRGKNQQSDSRSTVYRSRHAADPN